MLKQLESNRDVQKNIQTIIKNSNEEVAQALIKLAKEYPDHCLNPENPDRYIIMQLHSHLSILLNLTDYRYRSY